MNTIGSQQNAGTVARVGYPGPISVMPAHIQSGRGALVQVQAAGEGDRLTADRRPTVGLPTGCPPLNFFSAVVAFAAAVSDRILSSTFLTELTAMLVSAAGFFITFILSH